MTIKGGQLRIAAKNPCRVASTADIDLTTGGLISVDGVTVAAGDRVLAKDQTAGEENGIYIAGSGSWARAEDFDATVQDHVEAGLNTYIQEGTANAKKTFYLTTTGTITIDTTSLTFEEGPTAGAGGGGLGGSTGATDNALLRADGTGGSTVQASSVTLDDSDNIAGATSVAMAEQASAPVTPGSGNGAFWSKQIAGTNPSNVPYYTDENDLDVAIVRSVDLTRSMPSTAADSVELGSFTSSNGQSFGLVVHTGTATSNVYVAYYRVMVQNPVSTGGFVTLQPLYTGGPLNQGVFGDLIQVEMDVAVGGAISLRARSYVGIAQDVYFRLVLDGDDTGRFTPSSTQATTTPTTTNYGNTMLTMTDAVSSSLGGRGIVAWKPFYLEERSAADSDVAGFGQLWVRDDSPNVLVFTDDAGTDFVLSGAISGSTGATDNAILRADGTGGSTAQNSSILISDAGVLSPSVDDSGVLGSTSLQWSDLFLASGAVINFNSGDVTLTHAADTLTFGGAASGYDFDNPFFLTERAAALADQAGKGQLWVRNDTPNVLVFTDDAGTDIVLDGSAVLTEQTNTIYVSKAGNDSNDGLDIENAKLTIGSALTAASGLTPTTSNRVTIYIMDGGIYSEAPSLPDYVSLVGPGATVSGGSLTLGLESTVRLNRFIGTGTGVVCDSAGEHWVHIDTIEVTGGGTTSGVRGTGAGTVVHLNVGKIEVSGGTAIYNNNSNSATFYGFVGVIEITGAGWGLFANSNARFDLHIGRMFDGGTSTMGIDLSGSSITADLYIGEFNTQNTYQVDSGSTLNLFAGSLTGTAGTVGGTVNLTLAGAGPLTQTNAVYVSKAGDDNNDGLSPSAAKLTLGSAITAASGLTPGSSNRVTIYILDGGIYTDTGETLPDYVSLIGPGATHSADSLTLGLEGTLHIHRGIYTASGVVAAGAGRCWIKAGTIETTGGSTTSAIRTTDSAAEVYLDVDRVYASGGTALYLTNGNAGAMYGRVGEIEIGTGWGLFSYAGGTYDLTINRLFDGGSASMGVDLSGTGITAHLTVGEFNTQNTYQVDSGSTLNLFVGSITGSLGTVSGTANVTEAGAGGGISGSTGATDNAILRADGTGGSTAQSSSILIDDSDNLLMPTGTAINFNSGDVTLTHTADTLTFAGAASGYDFDNPFFLAERAAGLADQAGKGQLWVRSDTPNVLVFTDDAGTDWDLNTSSGSLGGSTGATDEAVILADGTGGSTVKAATLPLRTSEITAPSSVPVWPQPCLISPIWPQVLQIPWTGCLSPPTTECSCSIRRRAAKMEFTRSPPLAPGRTARGPVHPISLTPPLTTSRRASKPTWLTVTPGAGPGSQW